MADYNILEQKAAQAGSASMSEGASGYFSKPSSALDPNLFDGEKLKRDVRKQLNSTLMRFLARNANLKSPAKWLTIWLAGSGISYQWNADRGNGDLDVLYGVDLANFVQANPLWRWTSEDQLASMLNKFVKEHLWSETAQTRFGNRTYEVTYYLNPGVQRDITVIHPYAAYNLTTNSWDVRPPVLPDNPAQNYPKEWYDAADRDRAFAQSLTGRYNYLVRAMGSMQPNSPGWHNNGSMLELTVSQAQQLFQDIHQGRREAFSEQGHGYGDFHNFRWQEAKKNGVVESLAQITQVGESARTAEETKKYGAPITSADELLSRANIARGIR